MTIKVIGSEQVYKGWTTVSRVALSDGRKTFHRDVEDHGVAAAVLPYDAERRVALLVQVPRAPVMVVGETEPLLEAPAGLIDPGEDAETCAIREAQEEVGVELEHLERIGTIWSCPGLSTERITLFLAPFTAADRTGPGGGLVEEDENIVVVERSLLDLAALLDAGKLGDMKTFCLVQTLRLRRPELF